MRPATTANAVVAERHERTIAQDGSADFRTLTEALAAARPNTTLRILDDGRYEEAIVVGRDPRFTGLQLVSDQKASLAAPSAPAGELHTLTIEGADHVAIDGLRIESSGRGHAVFIRDDVGSVIIRNAVIRNAGESGPYATVQVFAASLAGVQGTIRLEKCDITSHGDSPCVWLHEPSLPIEITHCRLQTRGTCVAVWSPKGQLDIDHCVFRNSDSGINLAGDGPMGKVRLRVFNNTFDRTQFWLGVSIADAAESQARFCNNIILGSAGAQIAAELGLTSSPRWRFQSNVWEVPIASEDPTLGGLLARRRDPGQLGLDTDPQSPGYLTPAQDAKWAREGIGGEFPIYMGAIPPSE
jgi:hypothetical protein